MLQYWFRRNGKALKREFYESIFAVIRERPYGIFFVILLGKLLTWFTAVAYIFEVVILLWQGQYKAFAIVLAVPAISFVLVSLFRHKVNAKRPYELYGFTPLIPKDTAGKSFPSRHVFSIFVIATTVFFLQHNMGILLWAAGVCLAVVRVVAGVHFPRDVAAGAAIGILCGGAAGVLLKVL